MFQSMVDAFYQKMIFKNQSKVYFFFKKWLIKFRELEISKLRLTGVVELFVQYNPSKRSLHSPSLAEDALWNPSIFETWHMKQG